MNRAFYQRYVEEHVPFHRDPPAWKRWILSWLPYWSYREWRFWRRWLRRGDRILDLGCARGREVFGRAVGIDLARNALLDCRGRYAGAIEGGLSELPFVDRSFDCVVSSHVFGHVPVDYKEQVVAEIARVLRPGGRSLHVIETAGDHPLIEIAKQHPDLYQRHLIEPDGHVGLEPASHTLERFRQAGLRVERVYNWGTLHPRLIVKWFDNEYRQRSSELDDRVRFSRRALASPLQLARIEVLLGIHDALSDAPLERCPFIAVALSK